MCQHLMAPKVALAELEGCAQQDREGLQQCPPLFLPLPAILSLCHSLVGSCCADPAVPWLALLVTRSRPLKPRLQVSAVALGADTVSAEHLPVVWRSSSCWTATVVPPRDGKLLWDPVYLCLSPPAPAQHQKQKEADEGVAPVAQLKPGRNVGCCVMTKAHMLITSIS